MRRKIRISAACALIFAALALAPVGCGQKPDPGPAEGSGGAAASEPPQGETRTYSFGELKFEVTNVASERTETVSDDAGQPFSYTVIIYYPGARLTLIDADMSDPQYAADGKAHPQWGVLTDPDEPSNNLRLTDDTKTLDLAPEMKGIYSLESSMYIFGFEVCKD